MPMEHFTDIEKIEMQIVSLENKKKALSSENIARKERTRRLIQTGALAEKYFSIPPALSLDEREAFFKKAASLIKHK